MKNITIIVLLSLVTLGSVHGQVVLQDTTNHVTLAGYVGVLAGPILETEGGRVSSLATFQAGGSVDYVPKKWISFYGLGAFDINETGTITPLYLISMRFSLKKTSLIVGRMAAPITELRPLPATANAQFEAPTRAKILPGALGGKFRIALPKKCSVVTGAFWRGTETSLDLGFNSPHVRVAGYYLTKSHMFGLAAEGSVKFLTQVVVYNHNTRELSFNTSINIPRTRNISVYSDWMLNAQLWNFSRGEWGVLKSISYKVINVLVGGGVEFPNGNQFPNVKGYVMVSL